MHNRYAWALTVTKRNVMRLPLFTLEEIADRLGVDYAVLKGSMTRHNPPKPFGHPRVLHSRNASKYELGAMRKWWAEYQESKCPSQP